MMYGGRVIVLGNSGERVGEDMMGGEIYVGGSVDSLGNDAMLVEPSSTDIDSVMSFPGPLRPAVPRHIQKNRLRGQDPALRHRGTPPAQTSFL